jgi:UDP-N-acetylmuramate dehydrogenase
MNDTIFTELQKALGENVTSSVPLAIYTTLKIGGPAQYFFEARTTAQLLEGVTVARRLGIPVTVVGGGSNILIADAGIRGLVIKNMTKEIVVRAAKGKYEHGVPSGIVYVEADSGVIFNSFVRFAIEEGYQGIEMHLGLPGSVGGAVYMNSKWTNPVGYVGDVVYQATIVDGEGNVRDVPQSYFQFAYDSSILQKTNEIVLSVTFAFHRATKESLWESANRSIAYRRSTQPQGVFSPGCTFRNISLSDAMMASTPANTTSAGFLVDAAGLKGMRVGNAQISPVHANFIVNLGGASAKDVLELIGMAKAKVKEKFGVTLEEEIELMGEF